MKALLAAALISMPLAARAQADTVRWSVEGRMDRFTTDELGNLYTLRGNDLDLYDRHGAHVAHNSLNSFGPITRIDAFSSLKPLIFSRAQGQLALLDNTLSVQGSVVDLSRSGFPQVTLTCMSVQGRIWFFDERELALMRVDGQLHPVANTGRLDQLLPFTPQPTYMEESDGRLYLVDPANGVMVFDLFGTLVRNLPIRGAQRIQVRDGFIWYVENGRLNRYDTRAFTTDTVAWPTVTDTLPVIDARIEHALLYRLLPDRVLVERIGE